MIATITIIPIIINFFSNIIEISDNERRKLISPISKLKPAISAFTAHIGLKKKLSTMSNIGFSLRNIWFSDTIYVDKYYRDVFKGKIDYSKNVFLASIPSFNDESLCSSDSEVINIITGACYKDSGY